MRSYRIISLFTIMIIVMAAVVISSCSKKEDDNQTVPTVTTKDASDVTNSSAVMGGIVEDIGGSTIIIRGVCLSTSPNPTIYTSGNIEAGTGIGSFDCTPAACNSSTKYYFKAYAVNSYGVGYGSEKSFTTLDSNFGN